MLEVDLVMSPDGTARLNVISGTESFEEASAKVKAIAEQLQAQGIPVKIEGLPEQHREAHAPGIVHHQHA